MASGGGSAAGEGLWLATYDAATGIDYAEIPFPSVGLSFGSGTCAESEFFAWTSQAHLAFDPTSDPAGTAVAYLTSRHSDCGLARVEFDALDPTDTSTTTWTAQDTSPCTLAVERLRGLTIARDGRWRLAYGGPHTTGSPGGVCAVDLSGAVAPLQVVDGATMTVQFQTALAHPHIDDTFYLGGWSAPGSTHAGGVFALQRRYRPDTGSWSWAWRKLNGNDLEHRTVWDLAWGTGDVPLGNALKHLYVATSGGGFWDLPVAAQ